MTGKARSLAMQAVESLESGPVNVHTKTSMRANVNKIRERHRSMAPA